MIPRVLHRIWLGDRPRPTTYDDYWRQWANLHPDWLQFTWTEETMPPLRNQKQYDECELTARAGVPMDHKRAVAVQRADIAAYELIYSYGGVYLNCDMQPLRPLDGLLGHKAFAGMEDDQYLCNAVLGGEQGSPFFDAVINELPVRMASRPGAGMEVQTGPHLLTSIWLWAPHLITALPREAFYYAHHGDIQHGSDAAAYADAARQAGAYAIHHWGHRKQEGDYS